jgi:alkylated DNA repair dioxygenase AlkB
MQTLIETNKSFLKTIKYQNLNLLSKCVEDIEPLLIQNPPVKVFNKIGYQHRSVGFFSDQSIGYPYSGQIMNSQQLTDNLNNLLQETNILFQSNYNGILVNKYINGEDYIGAHSDDEKSLDKSGVVALSFGEPRKFRIRSKKDKTIVIDIPTEQGLYYQMGGDFQKEFTHEIPKQLKVKNCRYSFTFRSHKY